MYCRPDGATINGEPISHRSTVARMYLTKVSAGFAEGEFRHVDRIGPVRQGELDGRIVELLDMRAAAFIILNFLHADNLKQRIHLQLLLERG